MSEQPIAAPVAAPPAMPAEQVPDFLASVGEEAPRTSEARKPPRGLGTNKKRASGVRQLNKQDLDQLQSYYTAIGIMLMPINAGAATAVVQNSDECVAAWEDLAKQNDNVRRALLGIIEGGAWSKVIMAHMPIALAFVPGHVRNMIPFFDQEPQDTTESEQE